MKLKLSDLLGAERFGEAIDFKLPGPFISVTSYKLSPGVFVHVRHSRNEYIVTDGERAFTPKEWENGWVNFEPETIA